MGCWLSSWRSHPSSPAVCDGLVRIDLRDVVENDMASRRPWAHSMGPWRFPLSRVVVVVDVVVDIDAQAACDSSDTW